MYTAWSHFAMKRILAIVSEPVADDDDATTLISTTPGRVF